MKKGELNLEVITPADSGQSQNVGHGATSVLASEEFSYAKLLSRLEQYQEDEQDEKALLESEEFSYAKLLSQIEQYQQDVSESELVQAGAPAANPYPNLYARGAPFWLFAIGDWMYSDSSELNNVETTDSNNTVSRVNPA